MKQHCPTCDTELPTKVAVCWTCGHVLKQQQGGLFDAAAASEARDEAVERVGRHANGEWRARAGQIIATLARKQPSLTTDDVWREIAGEAVETHDPRAMGSAIQDAVRAGLIQGSATWVPSDRVACHKRPLRVWSSLVYRTD